MYKKTLLSLAVASSLVLTGCFEDSRTDKNAGAVTDDSIRIGEKEFFNQFEGKTWPIFNPATSELPLPNDLIFDQEAGDGSFSVPDTTPPVTSALNKLSGASTVAPAVIRFNGQIDADSVDSREFVLADPTDPTSLIPNPNQNVFLIGLEYPSQEPVRGLSAQEPPTIPLALTASAAGGGELEDNEEAVVKDFIDFDDGSALNLQQQAGQFLGNRLQNPPFDHDVVELDGTSALRIRPTQTLDPLRRYVVVVTDEVKDIEGDSISASPAYGNLSAEDRPLVVEDLAPVRNLINNFWENVASNYFNVTNQARAEALTDENVAISYSFTTSEDKNVLSYIAEPANWIADQVERSVRTQAAVGALDAGLEGFEAVRGAVNQAVANFTPSEDLDEALAPCDGHPQVFQCVGGAIKGQLMQGGLDFSAPSARNWTIDQSIRASDLSPLLDASVGADNVDVHFARIDLPYYLGVPSAENPAPIRTDAWTVDSGAAAAISDATGFAIPQADPDTSDVLNYNFPFPELQAEFDVPWLIMTPDPLGQETPFYDEDDLRNGECCTHVVIYQHGITTDRSTVLAFGSAVISSVLQASGGAETVAFVAIDQPLHGIDPDGSTFPSGMAATHEGQGINEGGITERHFGFEADAQGNADNPQPMNFDGDAVGGSGSLFINLGNFIVGRDVLRQGSLDLMNVRKTLQEEWDEASEANTFFVGHSLGTLTGGAFAGAVQQASAQSGDTDLQLAGVHMLTPVAGVVRLLENSPSFAPRILGGLQQAAGLTQGDSGLETFLNVNQHAIDSADPINFAGELAQMNTLLAQINGDRTTPNAADERFSGNVASFSEGTLPLDLTFPTGFQIQSFAAPLTGSEALGNLMGANSVERDSAVETPAISRYLEGVHATPVAPRPEFADEGDVLKDRTIAAGGEEVVSEPNAQAAFGEMVAQMIDLISDPTQIDRSAEEPDIIQDGDNE